MRHMVKKLYGEYLCGLLLLFAYCMICVSNSLADVQPEDPLLNEVAVSNQRKGGNTEEVIVAPINPLHPLADINDPQFKVKYEAYLRHYRERKRERRPSPVTDDSHPLARDLEKPE